MSIRNGKLVVPLKDAYPELQKMLDDKDKKISDYQEEIIDLKRKLAEYAYENGILTKTISGKSNIGKHFVRWIEKYDMTYSAMDIEQMIIEHNKCVESNFARGKIIEKIENYLSMRGISDTKRGIMAIIDGRR